MTERYIAIKNKTAKLFNERWKFLNILTRNFATSNVSIGQINLLTLCQCCHHGFQISYQ